jgi:hypothetical protein
MGIARRILPSSASLNSKADLMVGILEAQVEKLKPDKKKAKLRNTRCLVLEIMALNYNFPNNSKVHTVIAYSKDRFEIGIRFRAIQKSYFVV